jgi:CDP-diacylglycerol--glycerol-3-phosphate 3-phosphatidyltransferase
MATKKRDNSIKNGYLSFVDKVARAMSKTGLSPTFYTITGFVLAIFAGVALWLGHLIIGGILLFAGGIFDSMDGAIARLNGRATKFGALLDSTLDRYSEFAIYLGFYGYLGHSYAKFVEFYQIMAIFALVGSVMVSYVRARSEGLGIACSVGFWQRPERIIALGTASIFTGFLNPLFISISYNYMHDFFIKLVLIVLAIGTNITAVGRLFHGRDFLREKGLN